MLLMDTELDNTFIVHVKIIIGEKHEYMPLDVIRVLMLRYEYLKGQRCCSIYNYHLLAYTITIRHEAILC